MEREMEFGCPQRIKDRRVSPHNQPQLDKSLGPSSGQNAAGPLLSDGPREAEAQTRGLEGLRLSLGR